PPVPVGHGRGNGGHVHRGGQHLALADAHGRQQGLVLRGGEGRGEGGHAEVEVAVEAVALGRGDQGGGVQPGDDLGDQRGVAGGRERLGDALGAVGGLSGVAERPAADVDGLGAVHGGVGAEPGAEQRVVGDDLEGRSGRVLALQGAVEPSGDVGHGQDLPGGGADRDQGGRLGLPDDRVGGGLLDLQVDGEGDVLSRGALDGADDRGVLRFLDGVRALLDHLDQGGGGAGQARLQGALQTALADRVALVVGGAQFRDVLGGGGTDLADYHLDRPGDVRGVHGGAVGGQDAAAL